MLRYPYEVRGEEAYFEDIPDLKLPPEMRDLAGHIIDTKTGDFDPTKFEDAVIALIKSKETGEPIKAPAAPPPSNVVNLMDALRRSIEAEQPVAAKKAPSKTKAEHAPAKALKPR